MVKTKPFYTASAAAVLYFIIFITLKYFLHRDVDWQGAFYGAVGFWIVIFLVHYFLDKRSSD